ncbi:MAG TPA: PDZ domain-containing protein [Gammaproteobacteria bacterium]|nr:PDZ domain-containing protein [Gammaproteobacteria bacterium]
MKKSIVPIAILLAALPCLVWAAPSDTQASAARQAQKAQQAAQQQAAADQDRAQMEKALQAAQEKLQAAAQDVARLSMKLNGPDMERAMHMRLFRPNHAILGVTITDRDDDSDRDQGVRISAVSPGGPAEKAGLRAGDVITGINGSSFKSQHDDSATDQLMEYMDKVKPGDALKLSYLRDGKRGSVSLKAGRLDRDGFAFAFGMPPMPPMPPAPAGAPTPPVAPMPPRWHWFGDRDALWNDMQLVPLTKTLGQYFGTDKGLLVVHVPPKDALKLQDGDVILSIGGRVPGSPTHAMRILGSYSPGDTLPLDIMRKGKPLKLNIKLPEKSEGGDDISAFYREFHFAPSFLHYGFE